jgi:short-chain fatty acids transporter
MGMHQHIERFYRRFMPNPFALAIILCILVFLAAVFFTKPVEQNHFSYAYDVLSFWENGMWGEKLLAFLVQMMLMLVLGHALALSKPVDRLLNKVTNLCTNAQNAVAIVACATIVLSLFNWGLGLIGGAILSRKVGEKFNSNGKALNYGLLGAAGYSGFMVWHGGISGSATTGAADEGKWSAIIGAISPDRIPENFPKNIPVDDTIFSAMNLSASLLTLITMPLFFYWLAGKVKHDIPAIRKVNSKPKEEEINTTTADKIDNSKVLAYLIGFGILLYLAIKVYQSQESGLNFGFINPNFINFSLFGLAIVAHKNFKNFLSAIDEAIGGASGILIQFPLYFAILGMLSSSGLLGSIAEGFSAISNETTLPLLTMFSSGFINILVPSGGGQWAVQGPVVIESCINLGVPLEKGVMALSYGDQLTNMIQPFWALPLLAITGLKAKEILPYTLLLMFLGIVLFGGVLLVF